MELFTTLLSVEDFSENLFDSYRNFFYSLECPSSFLSPTVLKQAIESKGARLAIIQRPETEEVVFFQPFQSDTDPNELKLYGEDGADAIQLQFKSDLTESDKLVVLMSLLRTVQPRQIRFKKIRQNHPDTQLLLQAIRNLGLSVYENHYINCPLACFELDDDAAFRKIFNKSTIRNSLNRLQKNAVVTFETITSTENNLFTDWLHDFTLLHELRWANSHTPSIYREYKNRKTLTDKIKGGLKDSTVVLFSLIVNEQRKSLVYALKEGNRLIYHQIANDPDPQYYKLSLFKILIRHIGDWMRQHKMTVLDFGLGHEKYKFEFANQMEPMVEIFASSNPLTVKLEATVKKAYYKNQTLQGIYRKTLDSYLVTKINAQKLRLRARTLVTNALNDPSRFFRKAKANWSGKTSFFYLAPGSNRLSTTALQSPDLYQLFDVYEQEINLTPATRGNYILQTIRQQKVPYCLVENNNIQSVGWVERNTDPLLLPSHLQDAACWVISDCLTTRTERGRGNYVRLLKEIRNTQSIGYFVIYTDDWNIASQKGIQRAGFELYAIKNGNDFRFVNPG